MILHEIMFLNELIIGLQFPTQQTGKCRRLCGSVFGNAAAPTAHGGVPPGEGEGGLPAGELTDQDRKRCNEASSVNWPVDVFVLNAALCLRTHDPVAAAPGAAPTQASHPPRGPSAERSGLCPERDLALTSASGR